MAFFEHGWIRGTVAWAACFLAWTAVAAEPDANLLKNPGVEQYDQGLPVDWRLYVHPQEGAAGSLDRTSKTVQGRNALCLSTEKPYADEPYNNWSQNVVQDFSGKTLVLKGAIRTQDATDASIWVQCWRKVPWTLLGMSSSATVTPVGGTKDWTRVEARIQAPSGTDYVAVRCVLSGTGKAWFDDLSLTVEATKTPPPLASLPLPRPQVAPTTQTAEPAATQPQTPNVDPASLTLPSLMGLLSGEQEQDKDEVPTSALRLPTPPIPPRQPSVSAQPPQRPTPPQAENKNVQELINANQILMENYQALQQTNAELAEQVTSLQEEVEKLRKQVSAPRKSAKPAAPKAAKPVKEAAPPEPPPAAEAAVPEPPTPPPAPEPDAPPLVPSNKEDNS